MNRALLTFAFLLAAAAQLHAAEFYVDPAQGDPANDGTADKPWRNLQEVFRGGLVESQTWESLPYKQDSKLVAKNSGARIKAGDTIWLRSGDYGDLTIQGYYNPGVITIAAVEGQTPRFHSVHLRSASHWAVKGLHVSPEFGDGKMPRAMIHLESHGWQGPIRDVLVENCVLCSAEDTSKWSAADWNERSANGIDADGSRITIRGNRLKNVNFGISVSASDSLIEHNTVENFAGDGLRGLGDRSVFQYNVVKNCYDVNANHDDGFQSWSRGPKGVGTGEVVGIVLRGNTIINYEDPQQPHRGTLQGIGCFDGTFVDWVIENNVILTDHWHGITLLGARNCLVINNTVLDLNDSKPGPPWISIGNHKNGTASTDCVVRNNLATAFTSIPGVLQEYNLTIPDPASFFVDPAHFDLHLLPTAMAIDAGSSVNAPKLDRDRIPRPQGTGIDIGAYEWHTADVLPAEDQASGS